MPVEPPPVALGASRAADSGDGDLVAIGADLEPGTVLAAYRGGLFPMAVDGRAPARRPAWPGGRRRSAACCRSTGCGSPARCASRRGTSRSGSTPPSPRWSPAAPTPSRRRLDRRRDRHGVHRAAPARLGALRGDLARRRAGRRAVRRRHRRPVRRRVDVHPRARRLQGGADGPGRPAQRRVRRPPAARHPVADRAPGDARGGRGRRGRTTCERLAAATARCRCRRRFDGAEPRSDDERVPSPSATIGRPASTQSIIPPARLIASKPFSRRNAVAWDDRPPTLQTTSSCWSTGSSPARSGICVSGMCTRAVDVAVLPLEGLAHVEDGDALGNGIGDLGDLDRLELQSCRVRLLQQTGHAPVGQRLFLRSGRWRSTAGSSRRS